VTNILGKQKAVKNRERCWIKLSKSHFYVLFIQNYSFDAYFFESVFHFLDSRGESAAMIVEYNLLGATTFRTEQKVEPVTNEETDLSEIEQGATAVTTYRVKDTHQAEYNEWLREISPVCKTYPGHLDVQTIHPIPGLTATYTVIIRFDTREHLEQWMYSECRKRLVEKVQPFLAGRNDFYIRSGLDFWFTPEGARAQVPVRWKQVLITWSAIYPLAFVIPLAVSPLLRHVGIPEARYFDTLFITGAIVFLMVYFVMPRYTKLVQRWLFH